jgi:hypothetical protein
MLIVATMVCLAEAYRRSRSVWPLALAGALAGLASSTKYRRRRIGGGAGVVALRIVNPPVDGARRMAMLGLALFRTGVRHVLSARHAVRGVGPRGVPQGVRFLRVYE